MKRLAVYTLVLVAFNAMASMASAASRSIEFGKFVDSGEQEFIRRYVAESPYHQAAASYEPTAFEKIGVAKLDLNDDGVDELVLNFELSSYYCGTAGCNAYLFRKVNGAWQPIGNYQGIGASASDKKDGGWRQIDIQIGGAKDSVMKWKGNTY